MTYNPFGIVCNTQIGKYLFKINQIIKHPLHTNPLWGVYVIRKVISIIIEAHDIQSQRDCM
jgi:hypothetical protein